MIRYRIFKIGVGSIVALTGMQFIGPTRINQPVDRSIALSGVSAPRPVVALIERACYDCHSYETRWPWYSGVAPASWLVVGDVNAARRQLNFSRWRRYNPYDQADLLDKICDLASKRTMPLWQYRLLHPRARLSAAEITSLCAWTTAEASRVARAGS